MTVELVVNKKPDPFSQVRILYLWSRGQDLNLRPSGYEPDELPDCSTPQCKRLREQVLYLAALSTSSKIDDFLAIKV